MAYPEGLNMQTIIDVRRDTATAEEIIRLLMEELAEILTRIRG